MSSFRNVRILGVGKAAPDRVVTTAEIADILGVKPASWYTQMTGMQERRYLYEIDPQEGVPIIREDSPAPMILAEIALKNALKRAQLTADDLDGVIHVTCTPDELHFSQPAIALHARLGMRPVAFAEHLDSGCGGGMVAMMGAAERIQSGIRKYVAVVVSNMTSRYFNKAVYTMRDPDNGHGIASHLTMVLFGDGAACVILGSSEDEEEAGILSAFTHVVHNELVSHPAGGALIPSYTALPWQHTYFVHGAKVKKDYVDFMGRLLPTLRAGYQFGREDVVRYYVHPASGTMIEAALAATEFGEVRDRVPAMEHVRRFANLSPAGVFFQLAEDLEAGEVAIGTGQVIVLGAIGAGVHSGGFVVRL